MNAIKKDWWEVFNIEMRRNVHKVTISCTLIFLFLCAIVLQMTVGIYTNLEKKKDEFIEVEKSKIGRYVNYDQYALYGITRLFQSSPLFCLCINTTCFAELEGFFDSGVRMKTNFPKSDGNIFERQTGSSLDLSWFLLTVMSGLLLAWGFLSYRNTENYLKFLLNFARPKSVFVGIFLSRALLLLILLVLVLFVSIAIFFINDINILTEFNGLLYFLFVAYVVMVFFLSVSSILAAIRNTAKAVITAVLFWLIVVFLWPGVLNIVVSKKAANNIESRYQHQIRKLKILTDFEKLITEKSKEAKTRLEMIELNRNLTEKYWNEGFKQIEAIDKEMISDMGKHAHEFHLLSIFNPVTFYKSFNNEISSMGYNEYLRFLRSNMEKFKGFVRYYFDNRLYEKDPKVVSYLKDDEFIFKARSSLPGYFGAGVVLNLFYVLVAFGFGYLRFNRAIFVKPVKPGAYEDLDIKLEKGYNKFSYEAIEDFVGQLYNVFSGRAKRFTGNVSIEGESIVNREKQDFLYIPAPHDIPAEIKVKNMVNLFAKSSVLSKSDSENLKAELGTQLLSKRFGSLEKVEQVELLVKLAKLKKCHIIIVDNPFSEISTRGKDKFFEWVFNELKGSADVVLHLERPAGALQHKYDFYSVFYPGEEKYIEQRLK